MASADRYAQRGVSAQKEEVHQAVAALDKGLFPYTFCKVYPDYFTGNPEQCIIMHADGAGTKSSLAYLYWKETGDLGVWKGIAIDSIVMNLDDMMCTGAVGSFNYSSTIGRNKHLIPGAVLQQVINGTQEFFDQLKNHGIDIHFLGGETADIGDLVRTIVVDGTMTTMMKRSDVINPATITEGDVVVSFASFGKATYEDAYNSGMGSNGLTSARHEVLEHKYKSLYPESTDPDLDDSVVYNGKYSLTDEVGLELNVGKLLLSPTRTYAPLIKAILEKHRKQIHAIIHCSGGGQTKILHYLSRPLKVIKDNLIPHPPLFDIIQESAQTDWKEMYQVFNMGQRLEIYTDEKTAQNLISMAQDVGIEAQISGRVVASLTKEVEIVSNKGSFHYTHP